MPAPRVLQIENFRCLRSVEIGFEPLTVLVGPNASGKTALLDALTSGRTLSPDDVWQRRNALIRFEGRLVDNAKFGGTASGAPGNTQIRLPWRTVRLQLLPGALRQQNVVRREDELVRNGGNLSNVIGSLPRKTQGELAHRFCELVPLYRDVDVQPSQGGQHRVVFQDKWDASIWYEPEQVSDGSIVLLAFLTLTYLVTPPDLIAIEEPEHALHPYLLGEVVQMLRELAEGKLASQPVHVVLATHSAELLNFVRPEEVRFLSRNLEDGSTVVRKAPTEHEAWQRAYAEYQESLGELWLAGGLGGVPDTSAAE